MLNKLIILILLFISFGLLNASELHTFTSDLCTGYVEGTLKNPHQWERCCIEHDLYLWAGGSKLDRKLTDQRLRRCVKATGAPIHAQLIFLGVRLGSYSPIKFKGKAWSNGWKTPRPSLPLTNNEIDVIEEFLTYQPPQQLSTEEIEHFVEELRKR